VQSPMVTWVPGAYPGVGTVNGGYTGR